MLIEGSSFNPSAPPPRSPSRNEFSYRKTARVERSPAFRRFRGGAANSSEETRDEFSYPIKANGGEHLKVQACLSSRKARTWEQLLRHYRKYLVANVQFDGRNFAHAQYHFY